jgi:hypothetical protein
MIGRAVRDLEGLGLWRRLTRHLFEVYLSAREGAVNVPDDGHLADALLTARPRGAEFGSRCDIRFYPAAMARDLRRQARFFEHGLLARPAPSPRRFWVAILAHELAHCLPHRNPLRRVGERVAHGWEERVLRAAYGRL